MAFDWTALLWAFLIFGARILDVSLGVTRIMLMFRGQRKYAAILGFFEVIIFVTALGVVVNSLDNPINLIFYALGFSTGTYVGGYIEEKLALGYSTLLVIPQSEKSKDVADLLRAEGFGVTRMGGEGKMGPRDVLFITMQRRALRTALSLIDSVDENAFVTVMDTKTTYHGMFSSRKMK